MSTIENLVTRAPVLQLMSSSQSAKNTAAQIEDVWQRVTRDALGKSAHLQLLTLSVWLTHRESLLAQARATPDTIKLGVWLDSHEDPALLAPDLAALSLVAINFPTFKDGRGYSTAYLLRQRYGYTGALRAIGEILRDQLFYLNRVGFNQFQLRANANVEEAIAAFQDFRESYQGSIDEPRPFYQRRHIALARNEVSS
jgi:uncharacterized protein (DUF934 family)